jgi:magnesium-transporting ATPase (P-type)
MELHQTQPGHPPPWHALSIDEVLTELQTTRTGLSEEEARRRFEEYGPNLLLQEKKESSLARFLRQFKSILIYILLAAALIAALLGELIDMGVILAVVLIIAVIGYIQEGRAERALEAIRRMLSLDARVRRAGSTRTIPAAELVPGDLVLLKSGDKVPADLRLTAAKEVQVEEAVLTGESEPVSKSTEPVTPKAPVGDRLCLVFSSTLVTSGNLEGVVVGTGQQTEIGRIGQLVSEVEERTTPLLRKIDAFGRWLAAAILVLGVGVFAFGLLVRDYRVGEMLMMVVSLAVAAIPEGLPAVMTITLALGVQTMARRHAIIRRLPAVETLGSVTVICSDKTGTLTRNEMMVQAVVTVEHRYEISGTGYDPHGTVSVEGSEITREVIFEKRPELQELARAAILCNDSALELHEGQWRVQGDPTEGALLALGGRVGLDRAFEEKEQPRTDVIPFESEHRFMATLHHDHEGHGFIYVKGAPERLLEMCSSQRRHGRDEPLAPVFWQQAAAALAGRGQRVLATAGKPIAQGHRELNFAEVEGLTLLGLFGIADPPRPEAIEAVQACTAAGIRVKMITGDHARTAEAIARQMGICTTECGGTLSGAELEAMADDELRRQVAKVAVFARSSPEHKQRLVKALQAGGEIVAMTGDGVNDAPALKRADIGIAMGIKGSEAAKDAADMVLADDNFATIGRAVAEGRTVYDNLKKTILFVLPANGAESLAVISAVLFAFAVMPITPLQILWVNMVVSVTLGMSLAFEPAETDVMQRPPRRQDEPILSSHLLWRIIFVSVLIGSLVLWLFFRQLEAGVPTERARTLAVNTLVAGELFYLFNSRFLGRSSFTLKGLFGNRHALVAAFVLILLQLIFTYASPFQLWFETAGLSWREWLLAAGAGLMVFILVELEKAIVRRLGLWDQKNQGRNSDA